MASQAAEGWVDQRARLLARPRYEVMPVRGVEEKIAALPPDSLVTVTASPAHGLARTMEVAERLRAAGHEVVPHLAARMVEGRQELEETIRRCTEAGITEVFVVVAAIPRRPRASTHRPATCWRSSPAWSTPLFASASAATRKAIRW